MRYYNAKMPCACNSGTLKNYIRIRDPYTMEKINLNRRAASLRANQLKVKIHNEKEVSNEQPKDQPKELKKELKELQELRKLKTSEFKDVKDTNVKRMKNKITRRNYYLSNVDGKRR
jgi:hypothetical protein